MPRGHALNEAEKSRKCRLAALGNKNRLGQRWTLSPERLARGNKGWFKKGQVGNQLGKHFNLREKNPNWIADRSKLVKSEKKHLDGRYREWMISVRKRDGSMCKINNRDCQGRLESHHILDWVNYPELRYELNNGITLCHAHHPRGRAEEKRLVPTFMELVSVSK